MMNGSVLLSVLLVSWAMTDMPLGLGWNAEEGTSWMIVMFQKAENIGWVWMRWANVFGRMNDAF